MSIDQLEELLTPEEVAELLKKSRSWVYEAAKAELIPSVRLPGLGGRPGSLRFRLSAVRASIDGWTKTAA